MSRKRKTTLMLDEELYRRIRMKAAAEGTSISSVVAEATTAYLAGGERMKVDLPVFGGGGWKDPSYATMSTSELLEVLEGPAHR